MNSSVLPRMPFTQSSVDVLESPHTEMPDQPDDSLDRAREILRTQVTNLTNELSELDVRRADIVRRLATAERGLAAMEGTDIPHNHISYKVTPGEFSGKKLARAVLEYMEREKRDVHLDELHEALKQGGADLGSRGWTNVRIAVSTNKDKFSLDNKVVSLKKRKAEK